MLRHEAFLEEAARRGAAHPLGQDPLVGYLAMHAVDHAIQFGRDSIPARSVAGKVMTETLLLPDESPCKSRYYELLEAIRRGASWETLCVRLSQLAEALEGEGRFAEAEDVYRTLVEAHELPGVAAEVGEPAAVKALLGCARNLRKQAEFDQAEEWYARARDRAREAKLPDLEVSARVGLARLTIERGNYPKAQEILDEIHRDFVGVELSPHARGSIFHEMAIATKFRDRGKALRLLWEAFKAYDDAGDRQLVLFDIANELLESRCFGSARRAFELLEAHGTKEVAREAKRALLEIAWRTADRVLFGRVWADVSQSLDDLRPLTRAECCLYAGKALRRFGREAQGRALLVQALSIAQAFGISEVLVAADQAIQVEADAEIASLPETDTEAIEAVSEEVDALWRSNSLVPAT
jgi:tetratricopeptide (TPR) repeat protein